MTIMVAAIDDGSVAMRGAVEILRGHCLFSFFGVFKGVGDLTVPTGGERVVLLVDPFGGSGVDRTDLAGVPEPYATLVMSADIQADFVKYALLAGARGFISKKIDVSTLLNAINAVGYGGIYLGGLLDGTLIEQLGDTVAGPAPTVGTLTPRERDVLVMVAQGLTHKQIGARLNLSKATVDTYVHRMRQKVGSGNKAHLTRLAIDLGLLHGSDAA